jgi:hypothetical protein
MIRVSSIAPLLFGSALLLAMGCGSDASSTSGSAGTGGSGTGGGGGAGGAGTGGAGTGGAGTGGAVGQGGSGGTLNGNGGSGGAGGGGDACTSLTSFDYFQGVSGGFGGRLAQTLGGDAPDFVVLALPADTVGAQPLAVPTNISQCGDGGAICAYAIEDYDDATQVAARYYFATTGTATIDAWDGGFYGAGSIVGADLEEATIDETSGDVALTGSGLCVALVDFAFDSQPPVDGWNCNPLYYDETTQAAEFIYCDCECGGVDPDCADPMVVIEGCMTGQTCGSAGQCEGAPTGWTCAPDQYDGGAGNGCDCGCGLVDPDCSLTGEAVDGCNIGETCNVVGACLPQGWTCSAGFFGDNECDCGCGVLDIDCATPNLVDCDFCDDVGSCSTMGCAGNTQLNPMNNAVCL